MKRQIKQLIALIMVFSMCLGFMPTHVFATDLTDVSEQTEVTEYENVASTETATEIPEQVFPENTSELPEQISPEETLEEKTDDESQEETAAAVAAAEEKFAEATYSAPSELSLFPSSSSLTFDDSYTGAVGAIVSLTAVYVCEQMPTEFTWECSTENAISFSSTSVMGPVETGEENTYWISTAATAVKEGTHTVTLTVKADSAWTATATTEFTVTEAITSRYTVLILDTSGSMSGTPATVQKEAAIKFCNAITSASDANYVAIVKLNTSSSVGCEFTTDVNTLTTYINGIPASGGTNIYQALTVAKGLLDSKTDSAGIIKNIVLCSDGLPESGSTSASGPYTSADNSLYRYGNAVYNTAETIKEDNITIYTLGFFHSLSGSNLTFGRQLMTDIATTEDCYYEVTNVDDLEFTFDEIAGDITVEPVSIDLDYSTYVPASGGVIQYKITAVITNNSKTTDLTNLFVHLDEGDGAEILTEHGEWSQQADTLAAGASTEFSWVISLNAAQTYPDGGAHAFIVYAGSDETVTSSAQGSIAVAASNGASNELDFSKDVWNFPNISEDVVSTITNPDGTTTDILAAHPITEDDKNALLSGLSASGRAIVEEWLAEGTNGHCFGMALTTILGKMGIFDISDFSTAGNIRDADLTDRVWSILCYYHFLQSYNSFVSDAQSFRSENAAKQLSTIAELSDAVKSGGCPVLLSFGCEEWGNHAVVAYATESGSWTFDGKTYNKRILIYDSNTANGLWPLLNPIWDENSCLYFNEGTDEWIIPKYASYVKDEQTIPCMVSTNDKAYLKRACSDLDILNTRNYDANLYNYIAELRCQNETAVRLANANNQYIIMGKSGAVSGDTKLVTYYDDDVVSEEGNISTLHVILPDENEDYTLTTLSGKAEELDFYISDEDLFLSIDAEAAEGSAFALDGAVALRGNEGGYEVRIADDKIAAGEFNSFTFSGKNSGDISFEVTEDGVLISGDDLTDIAVSGSNGSTDSKISFSTDTDKVLVVPNDDHSKLLALVDTDGDEDFDTDIGKSDPDGSGESITVPATSNGEVFVTPTDAAEGDLVTITAVPDEGYQLVELNVTDGDGSILPLIRNDDGTFEFTMPDADVTIHAAFGEKIETVPMYRLFNPNTGEHFYTGSEEERDNLKAAGWSYEGEAWNAPVYIGEPVYRMFNPNSGDHHYTMSLEEVENLKEAGWRYEDVAWNSAPVNNVYSIPQYRLYNPNADLGCHHYTSSLEERQNLVDKGWNFEGIGWFGLLR